MKDQELKLWFNGGDTYVARSAEHARELMVAQTGESSDDVPCVEDWNVRCPRGGILSIHVEHDFHGESTVTKTVAEWIAENGAGFLCSTEF